MKTRPRTLLLLTAFALLAPAGCATSEQWAAWRSHSSHFASGQHAVFSFRNQGSEAERVRATDVDRAQDESWWGRQLPVARMEGN
jgi:hypothetical protein